MDLTWAQQRLEEYIGICVAYTDQLRSNGHHYDDECRRLDNAAEERAATITKIVKFTEPAWHGVVEAPGYSSSNGERLARRALGAVKDQAEWQTKLSPDAPVVSADQLHATVWRGASGVWSTGEYRVAVLQAASSLSAHVKARVGSPLSDRKLMQQVFAPEAPKPGQARLHFEGDQGDETWQSRQQGLHHIAQGAFAGLRNVAAHSEEQWSENEALEYLAVLSVVARWADETEKRTAV